jgi:hypothetical protein
VILEYFREDPIGSILFALGPRDKPVVLAQSVQTNYPNYVLRAFYLMMEDIQELEYSKGEIVPGGRNAIVASTYWFLSLESYISTLLKLTCLRLNKGFKVYNPKKPAEKLSALLELLAIDSVPIKKSGLYNRINEFTTFRNEIFHDRNAGQEVKFSKTLFCRFPIQCNLIDTLQGLLIVLETNHLLRLSVAGLDTMPAVLIHQQNKAFHRKLDVLFEAVIKPSVKEILAKHKLATNLDLDMTFPAAQRSDVFSKTETGAYMISDSPDNFKFALNPETTNISFGKFMQIVDQEQIGPDQFSLGQYSLD